MAMHGGYRINNAILQELEGIDYPDTQLQLLKESIIDEYFDSEKRFQCRVKELLGESVTPEQLDVISRKARRFRLKRLLNATRAKRDFYVPRSRVLVPLINYLSITPTMLFLRLRSRLFYFWLSSKLQGGNHLASEKNANNAGFIHNYKQMLDFSYGHRNRTERLMNALRNIDNYDIGKSRTLVVGPRNEAEILLLRAYGFKKLTAIDLFTYSPLIQTMDMNELAFQDDSFDIYYSAAVIRYSPDIRATVSEAVRVTRNGGVMAFCFMYGWSTDLVPAGSELGGGVRELLNFFGEHVDHVYWHQEFAIAQHDIKAAVIFRIKK